MKKTLLLFFISAALLPLFNACIPEEASIETEQGWLTYEVRDGLSFNDAWMIVVDALLTRGFQFETISKEDGYLKTEYYHDKFDTKGIELRSRVAVKFSYGRKTVRVKIDEDYLMGAKVPGYDIPRVADLKAELRDRLL
jgi:hypothetical protein